MAEWFQLPGGKTHMLIKDDEKRFPLGRALCAPFDRRRQDPLFDTNEMDRKNVCGFCTAEVSKKGKNGTSK